MPFYNTPLLRHCTGFHLQAGCFEWMPGCSKLPRRVSCVAGNWKPSTHRIKEGAEVSSSNPWEVGSPLDSSREGNKWVSCFSFTQGSLLGLDTLEMPQNSDGTDSDGTRVPDLGQCTGLHASLLTNPSIFPLLIPICLLAVRPQTCPGPPHPCPRPCLGATHHPDRSEGHQPVAAVAAGPGVPAWVLALLQDKHLPPEVGLLKGDPAGCERDAEGKEGQRQKGEKSLAEAPHPLAR